MRLDPIRIRIASSFRFYSNGKPEVLIDSPTQNSAPLGEVSPTQTQVGETRTGDSHAEHTQMGLTNAACVIDELCRRYPDLLGKLFLPGQKKLRPDIGLYLNESPKWLTGDLAEVSLQPGDLLDLDWLCGVAGGCAGE